MCYFTLMEMEPEYYRSGDKNILYFIYAVNYYDQ